MPNLVQIAYGEGHLPLTLTPRAANWRVLRPRHTPPLPDASSVFAEVCRRPIGAKPLRDLIHPTDRVVIVTSDHTRPVPNQLLIPWLLKEMNLPPGQVTVLVGTGTHRAPTSLELEAMFGADLLRAVPVIAHDAFDATQQEKVGCAPEGIPVSLNRHYVHATRRIALGFIEPHFFAGFSGGPKAIAPGIAALETILALHRFDLIADPRSTWAEMTQNPVQQAIRAAVALCPPDFLVNVTLSPEKAITGIFAGHYLHAHQEGCAHARREAIAAVGRRFPLVITSNSGYPLDQNLYQTVKGISAAARITEPGGTILAVSECRDGIPEGGNFGDLLSSGTTAEQLLEAWQQSSAPMLEQWQVQILLNIQKTAKLLLYSSMCPDLVRRCGLTPVGILDNAVREAIHTAGHGCPVALLPDGPLTIPTVVPFSA